jgi:hypothetical protein
MILEIVVGGAGVAAIVVVVSMALGMAREAAKQRCFDIITDGESFHDDDLAATAVRGRRQYAKLLRLHKKRKDI